MIKKLGHIRICGYFNDQLIAETYWACELYTDILDTFKIPYQYATYQLEWDVWEKEKKLILVLEDEENRHQKAEE
jgi:hypothetical protein